MNEKNGQRFYKQYDVSIDRDNDRITLTLSHDTVQQASYAFDHFGVTISSEIDEIENAIEQWIDEQEQQ